MQLQNNSSVKRVVWALGVSVTVVLAFWAGFAVGRPQNLMAAQDGAAVSGTVASISGVGSVPPGDLQLGTDFKQFWDLWKKLKDNYYKKPLDERKMMYGAMKGLADSLEDPYTVFLEPITANEFSQSLQGKFEGIGAEIGIKDDQLQVISPLPDTPAEKAGLKAGDFILKIDSEDTTGMPVEKAVSLIRGDKGTEVVLTVGRYKVEKDSKGNEKKTPYTEEIKIVRDVIVVKSVRVEYRDDGIAVIEISSFNQDTSGLMEQAADEVTAKGVKGIILDLRNNPGGYLESSISVAGEWAGNQVVVKERRQGKVVDQYHGTASGLLRQLPTVVLVNEGSASASEIVAGALQDYALAKLVGTKTYGKGSVQDYMDFADGSAVKITIAEWLTPHGRLIDKLGIDPDFVVEMTQEDYHADRDPQLDKAVELLTAQK
ncbi:MAG: S41 family peptidase [Patescibacteria group bacterium]|nr:S41 family peptidase [Patescibacteria group bacterium]